MRNIVYLCLTLFFIIHNVKSRNHDHRRSELKTVAKNPKRSGEKFDMSKFVNGLLKDAKRIEQKHKMARKNIKRRQQRTTESTITKTVAEGFESSYDSLGLDENTKDKIVNSNTPVIDLKQMGQVFKSNQGLDYQKMRQLFRSNDQGLGYQKLGQILRSNVGVDDMKTEKGALRTADRESDEEGAELVFDLEDEDGLKNPLF